MGRATLFTEAAIKKLAETKMFTKDFKGAEKVKKAKSEKTAPEKKEKKNERK
jgi:hypothetical protein